MRIGWVVALALLVAGCSSRKVVKRPRVPTSNQEVGSCADPERDGVVGDTPRLERHDRDLDGDGQPETVVVDRTLCTSDGNCHWNVFARSVGAPCNRYVGTIAAAHMQVLGEAGDRGFRDVRAWWRLTGGGRLLVEHYRFRHGGYRVVDALLCRRANDDTIACARDTDERVRDGLP